MITYTKSFRKDFAELVSNNPRNESEFLKFMNFKMENPNKPFNDRDRNYYNHRLKGFYHYHMHYGNVILHYYAEGSIMELLAIDDHKFHENEVRLSAKLHNSRIVARVPFRMDDFIPDQVDDETAVIVKTTLTTDKKFVRPYLAKFIGGDESELIEYINLVLEDKGKNIQFTKNHLISVFGCRKNMKSFMRSHI